MKASDVVLALQEDLSTGINKLDIFEVMAAKVFNTTEVSKEERQKIKELFFSFISDHKSSATPESEEFIKQFPCLMSYIKEDTVKVPHPAEKLYEKQ